MTLASQIKWSVTIRGKPKLVLKGHMYRKDKENKKKNTTRYRCCEQGCKGSITLHNLTKNITSFNSEHKHSEMTEGQIAAKMGQRDMYEQSRNLEADPAQVMHSVASRLPEIAHPHMPSDDTLRRTIQAIAARTGPKNPNTLAELVIPEPFRQTLVGEEWLIHESPIEHADSRIFVFGTRKMLQQLSIAEVFIYLGTYGLYYIDKKY